jgi:hypothetical protein
MLRKKSSEITEIHPATQSGSYTSFRKRKLSRRAKLIMVAVLLVVLAVPAVLLAKSLYAYKSVVQKHTGVSSEVLTKKAAEFDSKTEAEGRVNILLIGVGDAGHAGST